MGKKRQGLPPFSFLAGSAHVCEDAVDVGCNISPERESREAKGSQLRKERVEREGERKGKKERRGWGEERKKV